MKKLLFLLVFICIFTASVFGESTFVYKDVYHYGFISPHPDSVGKLYIGSDSIPWKYVGAIQHYFHPQGTYPVSPDTGTIFYFKGVGNPDAGWRGYGKDGWVKIPAIDTLYPSQIRNYDYVYTVTDTPIIKYDFTSLEEAIDTANLYATDSTRCLIRIMPGIYHLSDSMVCSSYVDIEGVGNPILYVDSLPHGGEDDNWLMKIGDTRISGFTMKLTSKVHPGVDVFKCAINNVGTISFSDICFQADSIVKLFDQIYSPDTVYYRDIRIYGTASDNLKPSDLKKVDNFLWIGGDTVSTIAVLRMPGNTGVGIINNAYIFAPHPNDSGAGEGYRINQQCKELYLNNVNMLGNNPKAIGGGNGYLEIRDSYIKAGRPLHNIIQDSILIDNTTIIGSTCPSALEGIIELNEGVSADVKIRYSTLINHSKGGILANHENGATFEFDHCYMYDDATANGMLDGKGTIIVRKSVLIQESANVGGANMIRIDYVGDFKFVGSYLRNKRGPVVALSRPEEGIQTVDFSNCVLVSDSSHCVWLENVNAQYDINFVASGSKFYSHTMGNISGSRPATIWIKQNAPTLGDKETDVKISDCILDEKIGIPIWRNSTEHPCSIYVELSTLIARDSSMVIKTDGNEDSLSVLIGPGNSFVPYNIGPSYAITTDTLGHYGVTYFADPIKAPLVVESDSNAINISGISLTNYYAALIGSIKKPGASTKDFCGILGHAGAENSTGSGNRVGVIGYAHDTLGSDTAIGVIGYAECDVAGKHTTIIGGKFVTNSCGDSKHFGVYAYAPSDAGNDSDCYGVYAKVVHANANAVDFGIYAEAPDWAGWLEGNMTVTGNSFLGDTADTSSLIKGSIIRWTNAAEAGTLEIFVGDTSIINSNIILKLIAPTYELVAYFIADSAAFANWVTADSIDADHAVLDKIVGNNADIDTIIADILHSTGFITAEDSGFIYNPDSNSVGVNIKFPSSLYQLDVGGYIRVGSRTGGLSENFLGAMAHVTPGEEDILLFSSTTGTNENIMNVGGGSGSRNSMTAINFYIGDTWTTTTGTHKIQIDKDSTSFYDDVVMDSSLTVDSLDAVEADIDSAWIDFLDVNTYVNFTGADSVHFAAYWKGTKDIIIPSWALDGINPPAIGTESGFDTRDFDATTSEIMRAVIGLPSGYIDGDSIKLLYDIFVDLAPIADTFVVMKLTYKMITADSVFSFAAGTSTKSDTITLGTTNKKVYSGGICFPGTGIVGPCILLFEFVRDPANAKDDFKNDARLCYTGWTYKSKTVGGDE